MKTILNQVLTYLPTKKKPVLIAGHGRSGTTWIGKTISKAENVLYYNEPCNDNITKEKKHDWIWRKYIPLNDRNSYFEYYLNGAFNGQIMPGSTWYRKKPWARLSPNSVIVIKEVAASMSINWVYKLYQPRVFVVVRHPCAVVLSNKKRGNLSQQAKRIESIKNMVKDKTLVRDYLSSYLSVIEKIETISEADAVFWAIRNLILADFLSKHQEQKIIYYEDVCRNPTIEFAKIFEQMRLNLSQKVQDFIEQTTSCDRPGTYSTSRITSKQIGKWKRELSQDEIYRVRKIVEQFNLPFYNSESDWK